ncbi:MAG: cytidylate kinase-like family protein [Gemmataceae bacterium]
MTDLDAAPLHGYRGERPADDPRCWPAGLTVTISREAGARGSSIARRVGRKLGWQVFDQDQLEYLAQDGRALDDLDESAREWVGIRLDQLMRARAISDDPESIALARVVLALGANGEAVLIGRGAGYILPSETTLHVRVVAPLADRVAYMAQWLRLSDEAAAEAVRQRDVRRSEFLAKHFHQRPDDLYSYDLVLNCGRLGEELSAETVAQTAKAKVLALQPTDDEPTA